MLYPDTGARIQTPLSIAIGKDAAPNVVECLVFHDQTHPKQTLLAQDRIGDTPLLQAIRSSKDSMVDILLKADTSKQSLLVPSRKRTKTPIFYVANQELLCMYETDDELPEGLQSILRQTYHALQIRQEIASAQTQDNPTVDCDEQGDDYYFEPDDESLLDNPKEYMLLLKATVACAHLLGGKCAPKILQFLLQRMELETVRQLDADRNTLLHHVCRAKESRIFLESDLRLNEPMDLIEFMHKRHVGMFEEPNCMGELALHVAIQASKDWEYMERLLAVYPHAVQHKTNSGELPLHLAIKYHADLGVLEELRNRFPEAATIMDGPTRLVPFQLASCSDPPQDDSCIDSGMIETAEVAHVNSIYFFLRGAPHALRPFF
jgi:hypothetical protein